MYPELLFLPEHGSNLISKLLSLFCGVDSQHTGLSAVRVKNPRQHLNRGALSRPVRADKGKRLSLLHRKGYAAYRLNLLCLLSQDCTDAAFHSLFLPLHPEGFRQIFRFDNFHHFSLLKS